MSIDNQETSFSAKKAIDNKGCTVCRESAKQLILDIVKNLGKYTGRPLDLYGNEISEITTKLENGFLTILFRIGILYCEAKAIFDTNTLTLKNTVLGISY